jgi:HD-like signal output (HDOD) protein
VHQAITYLGLREVAAITFEIGLRAAFPPAALLEPLWQRAAERGVLMGRLAARLSLDAWAAHSAGLFEECGKAVLYRHDARRYAPLLRAADSDTELVRRERDVFGVSHDALGAAMCESWGLGAAAVASVRHHVAAQAALELPPPARRGVCALSVLAALIAHDPAQLEATVPVLAPQADLDESLVLRAVVQVLQQQADERARQQRHAA